jgi:hypothetical protein
MNEKQEQVLELLKVYCNNDKNRLNLLEDSIKNGNVVLEENGSITYHKEYILADTELQTKINN